MDINKEYEKINKIISSKNTYDDLINILLNKELVYNTNDLLDQILNTDNSVQRAKTFLTIWLVRKYPEDFFGSDFLEHRMYILSQEILDGKELHTKVDQIYEFFREFDVWKDADKIEFEEYLIKNYYNLQYNIDAIVSDNALDLLENEDLKEFIVLNKKEQEKIKTRLLKLNNNNTDILEKLENYKYTSPESLFGKVSRCIETTYWDKLKEDLKNFEFKTFQFMLEDIQKILSFLLKKDKTKLNELREYFDIDFIISQLSNGILTADEINMQVKYLYSVLKEIQAPADDIINEKWFNELVESEDNMLMYDFIIGFFKGYMNKIIKIFKIVKELQF